MHPLVAKLIEQAASTGSRYVAYIAGMWADTTGCKDRIPLAGDLLEWFEVGKDASRDARKKR